MEKVETKTRQIEDRTHHFYCDNCGTHIGSSDEYEDGYYEELGEFELSWFTPDGWYKLKKCLCPSCRDELLADIYDAIEDIGFKLDRY